MCRVQLRCFVKVEAEEVEQRVFATLHTSIVFDPDQQSGRDYRESNTESTVIGVVALCPVDLEAVCVTGCIDGQPPMSHQGLLVEPVKVQATPLGVDPSWIDVHLVGDLDFSLQLQFRQIPLLEDWD
jgi:hypothetical protein